jgi:hypothetical protein
LSQSSGCTFKAKGMFFLARSIFWLGVLFSWIPWHGDDGTTVGPRAAVVSLARDAAAAAPAQIEKFCLKTPRDCLAVAGKAQQVLSIESLLEWDAANPAPRPVKARAFN